MAHGRHRHRLRRGVPLRAPESGNPRCATAGRRHRGPRPRGRRRRRRLGLHPDRERHRPERPARGPCRRACARAAGWTRRRARGRRGRSDPRRRHGRDTRDSSSTPVHPRQDRRRRVPDRPAAELERQAPDDEPRVLRQRVQQRQHLQERRFATRLRLRGRRRGLVSADDRQRAGGLLLRVATATRRAQPARRRRRRRPLRPAAGTQRVRRPLQRRPPRQVADRVLPRALRRRR